MERRLIDIDLDHGFYSTTGVDRSLLIPRDTLPSVPAKVRGPQRVLIDTTIADFKRSWPELAVYIETHYSSRLGKAYNRANSRIIISLSVHVGSTVDPNTSMFVRTRIPEHSTFKRALREMYDETADTLFNTLIPSYSHRLDVDSARNMSTYTGSMAIMSRKDYYDAYDDDLVEDSLQRMRALLSVI